jgi:phage-related protein
LVGPTGSGTFNTRKAQFGDGYKQIVGDGINTEWQSWPLSWLCTWTQAVALMAWIRAHPYQVSFFWTPPLGVQGYYRIVSYTAVANGGNVAKHLDTYTITATFEQDFKP